MFSLKRIIRDYFGFSKTQTNGFLVLMPLLVLILVSPYLFRRLTLKSYDKFERDQVILDSLVAIWSQVNQPIEDNGAIIELKYFNPNLSSIDELQAIGFNKSLATRIDNYKKAGGVFKRKEDLRKIYGVTDSIYLAIASYILIPTTAVKSTHNRLENEKRKTDTSRRANEKALMEPMKREVVLSINSADSLAFQTLKGIGPAYSRRIVSYREALGGFTSIDQLNEVYGISDSLYHQIKSYVRLDSMALKQININLATFKELNAHPYISFEQTKEILNLKSKNGKYSGLEDLRRLTTFDSTQLAKLFPYLKF